MKSIRMALRYISNQETQEADGATAGDGQSRKGNARGAAVGKCGAGVAGASRRQNAAQEAATETQLHR